MALTTRERRAREWAARKAQWDALSLCTGCGRNRDLRRNGKVLKRCAACLCRVRVARQTAAPRRDRYVQQTTVSGKTTPAFRAMLKREHLTVMQAQFTRIQVQLAQRTLMLDSDTANTQYVDWSQGVTDTATLRDCEMEYRR